MTKQEMKQRLEAIEARGANIAGMHERFRLYAAENPERDAVAMLVHDVLYGSLASTPEDEAQDGESTPLRAVS